jgi:hypothetical protein
MNEFDYLFNLAGYPALFNIRYPAGCPTSQIRYPAGFQKRSDIWRIPIENFYKLEQKVSNNRTLSQPVFQIRIRILWSPGSGSMMSRKKEKVQPKDK